MPTINTTCRYSPMLHGVATTLFTQIVTAVNLPDIDPLTGAAMYRKGDLDLTIEHAEYVRADISVQTHKLFDVLVLALGAQNTYRCPTSKLKTQVAISLDEYLALCAKPRTKASKDELRKAVSKDLDILYRISIEWYELRGGKTQHFLKMRLFDRIGIINGYIVVNFTSQMAEYLTHAYVTQYPLALLTVDGRQRAAYYAGKKLAYHYGLRQNQKKGSQNCISVSKLLEAIPEIPSIDVINKTDTGHWARRIRIPLERALNALIQKGVLTCWKYCLSGKQEIPDFEKYSVSYAEFNKLYIHFELKDYPVKK